MDESMNLKKTVNHMSWGLVIYSIINFVLTILLIFGYLIIRLLKMVILDKASEAEMDRLWENAIESDNLLGGITCISVLVGVGFLFWYFRKRIGVKQILVSHRKMTVKTFGKVFCLFMGVQLIFEMLYWIMEKGFNVFGYSVSASMEEACANETAFFMILYSAIVGPIVEEVIYRGFVLASVQKYGKVFAIVISSVLFGVMHANIPQSAFAFIVGLILGYVALEYSIGWSMLLHIINNGVFGELLYFLISGRSEQQQSGIIWGIMIVFFLLGVFFLWKWRKDIRDYVMQNRVEDRKMLYAFTTIGMVIFIVMEMLVAFDGIEKFRM